MAPSEPLTGPVWRVAVSIPARAQAAFEAVFEDAAAVSVLGEGGRIRIDAWTDKPPDRRALETRVAVAAAAGGVPAPAIEVAKVEEQDWIAATRAAFPPVNIGRFTIYGSHAEPPPPGRLGLRIDANLAFGTGEHPSTAGCLSALEALAKRRRVATALDMGCGTGILAMAMARLWPCRVLAVDSDADAVRVARVNLRANGLGARVRVGLGAGYASRAVAGWGRVDLICANILARPLAAMAPGLAAHLAPCGVAVVSGLLAEQETFVLAAHRAQGLALIGRTRLGPWTTLALARPGRG